MNSQIDNITNDLGCLSLTTSSVDVDTITNGLNNISLISPEEVARKKFIQAGKDRLTRMRTTGYSKPKGKSSGSLFNPKPTRK